MIPSLRGRIFRHLVRRVVGTKFRRAHSVSAMRDLTDFLVKSQRVPADTEIRPVDIQGTPAEWVASPGALPGRVILWLHGGGFIMGSPATHRELGALLSSACRARVLLLDYPLAPEHPFPAALEAAIDAFHWLREGGHSPVIGGDSAGGGLTLQALITLRDRGDPLPPAAILLSPITDWVRFDGESYRTRAKVDPLITPQMCRHSARYYIGKNDPDLPIFSPTRMDLTGLPPLSVHVGDCEVLLDDSRALARATTVDLHVWPGMWHVFQAGARLVPEGRRSLQEIGRFVDKHIP